MPEYIVDSEEERLFYGDKYEHLIRCKDCKYWNEDYRECQSPNWDTGTDDYFVTPAGFYCGWAERKEHD